MARCITGILQFERVIFALPASGTLWPSRRLPRIFCMTSTDRPSHHPETPARVGFDLVLALGVAAIILLGLWLWRPWKTHPSVQKRVAWTTSHIHSTPEPPPPYEIHRLFPKLASLNNPL